jgi:predicted DNA-binding transcriptional regulator AlpA
MDDRLLTIEETAAILNTSTDWLYRHWKKLPFAVQLSKKQIRFSARGIEEFINARKRVQERAGMVGEVLP